MELVAPRVEADGGEVFAPARALREGAFALLRHARALEDYFAGWRDGGGETSGPDAPAMRPGREGDGGGEDESFGEAMDCRSVGVGVVVPMISPVDAMLVRALAPLWDTSAPCSVEAVEAARLFWEIGRRLEPVAVAAGLTGADSLRRDLECLHERFSDRLERLAAAFVHPLPAAFADGACPTRGRLDASESIDETASVGTDAGKNAAEPSGELGATSGGKAKDRRIKGAVWYELTDDGARVKRAAIASGKKAGVITFDDRAIHRGAEQLFIRAAAEAAFTRHDVKDIIDEFMMSDASQDKVRDTLDYQICRAIGATGKGRDKPKAFTLADKLYTSDLTFTCLNGLSDAERRDQQQALTEFAVTLGGGSGEGRGFNALPSDLD